MKRLFPIAALAATVLLAQTSTAADWKSFAPADFARKIRISLEGKDLTYYRFDEGTPLSFSVEGPTRVKILTRARIPEGVSDVRYTVWVELDGAEREEAVLTAGPKEGASYVASDDASPGVIRRIYLDVPTGTHGYTLRPATGAEIDARLFRSAARSPKRVAMAPSEFGQVTTFVYREKELTYYLMGDGTTITFDVVGPTELKVNTRLVYDSTMMGSQTYMIGVTEDGGTERLYKLEGEPSQSVIARDQSDVVPGVLRYFFLDVAPGPHTFTFRYAEGPAAQVAVKFYIPRGDLSNES